MALNTFYPNYTNPYSAYPSPYLQQNQQLLPPIQAAQPQQQGVQPSINWVSGDREAAAYPVAPNNAVALWSQSEPVVYLKQADATGKPSMKIYDLVERTQAVQPTEEKVFATREELERVKEEIGSLRSELAKRKQPVRRREEDEE